MSKIDLLDKKILYFLLRDGRMSYLELAKKTGTKIDKVIYHIKKLLKEKVIIGFKTVIDYEALNYSTYNVFIKLKQLTRKTKQEAENFLKHYPFILWVGTCIDRYHLRADVLAKNEKQLRIRLKEIYKNLNYNIKEVIIAGKTKKRFTNNNFFFTYPPTEEGLKEIRKMEFNPRKRGEKDPSILKQKDWKIIYHLCKDPRISFKELGNKIKATPEDARYRFKKILSTKVIHRFSINIDYSKFGLIWWILLIKIKNKEKENEITNYLLNHPQTSNVMDIVSDWDLEVTFFSKDIQDREDYMLELGENFQEEIEDTATMILTDSLKHPHMAEGIFLKQKTL